MKTYKTFKSEQPVSLEEALSISKLKKLKLVSDEEFSQFLKVMKKLDADKPVPMKEKDIIMKVFNELVIIPYNRKQWSRNGSEPAQV